MKANITVVLTLILLNLMTAACSSTSPMENQLVGEWKSNGRETVHLKIAVIGTDGDGYHRGYSSTDGGKITDFKWKIPSDGRQLLFLKPETPRDSATPDLDRLIGVDKMVLGIKIDFLAADRFVLDHGAPIAINNIEEFYRVK